MKIFTILFAVIIAMLVGGCASVAPGSDPLIVHAQQVKRNYLYSADTLVKFEFNHRNELWKVNTGIKKTTDSIRELTPVFLDSMDKSIATYKVYKNAVNKDDLTTQIKLLTDNIAIIAKTYADAKTKIGVK